MYCCVICTVCLQSTGWANNNLEGKQRRCTGAYWSWLMKGSQISCRLAHCRTASSVNINFPWRGVPAPSPQTLLNILQEVTREGHIQSSLAAKLKCFINGLKMFFIQSVFSCYFFFFFSLFSVLMDALMFQSDLIFQSNWVFNESELPAFF